MNRLSPSLIGQQLDTLEELYGQELPDILRKGMKIPLPSGIRRVYALGNGDSYHAAVSAAQCFAEWTDIEYIPMPAYTFLTKHLPRLRPQDAWKTLVVCISASGSSKMAVSIFQGVREAGVGLTLSIAGRPGCAMDAAAEWALSTAISEKGRSPGIRTFAASLCGLLALAGRLGGRSTRPVTAARHLEDVASQLPRLVLQSRELAAAASKWDWPLGMILGCDGLLGCAQFIAAKFAEGCGVFAGAHELEEWCHVESMTYPLNAPVVILVGAPETRAQAIKAAGVARRAGRPVFIIASKPDDDLTAASDLFLALDIDCPDAVSALFGYIPGAALAQALAEKHGRAMFLSDQPINLFG